MIGDAMLACFGIGLQLISVVYISCIKTDRFLSDLQFVQRQQFSAYSYNNAKSNNILKLFSIHCSYGLLCLSYPNIESKELLKCDLCQTRESHVY